MSWHATGDVVLTWTPVVAAVTAAILAAWSLRHSAKASRAAAESVEIAKTAIGIAKESAVSSQRSADAATANLSINFSIAPWFTLDLTATMTGWGVTLFCDGATVYVHRLVLDFAGEPVRFAPGADVMFQTLMLYHVELPLGEGHEAEMPARLHRGESLSFMREEQPQPVPDIGQLTVTVHYSLDGGDKTWSREVDWRGKRGTDYEPETVRLVSPQERQRVEAEVETFPKRPPRRN